MKKEVKPQKCKCGKCNQYTTIYKGKARDYVNGHNAYFIKRLGKSGPTSPSWKGGRVKVGKYWMVYQPDHLNSDKRGYVYEHRFVMSIHIGRPIWKYEVVHHINGNKIDNKIENLELIKSNSKHIKEKHLLKDKTNRFCCYCRNKTYTTKKGHEKWYYNLTRDKWVCDKCYKRIKKGQILIIPNIV